MQYSEYGPSSVLHIVERAEPEPPAGRIRIAVRAVGVNPFDWKVRNGAFGTSPDRLPMIPHSDAAGVVDAVGEGVEGVAVGDEVFGVAEGGAAAEHAILRHWAAKPPALSFTEAAGLPNVVETAGRALDLLGLGRTQPPATAHGPAAAQGPATAHGTTTATAPGTASTGDAGTGASAASSSPAPTAAAPSGNAPAGGVSAGDTATSGVAGNTATGGVSGGAATSGVAGGAATSGEPGGEGRAAHRDDAQPAAGVTLVVNGAAGGVGIAAVQIAIARGATVIGTASERNHDFLRGLGVIPVTYGPGLADRIRALAPDGVDRALDTAGRGAVAELVTLTPTPADVVSIADFDAPKLGARVTDGSEGRAYQTMHEAAALYTAGRFSMPVERTFPLEEAAAANDLSESGHVRGKIVITI
ncbi:NADP-dependent oxidoreductase [Dactylosporangium sp. CA-052675]|uniref:NADP-dependent oxidoreductase n=1 Tax=Dactylosporangium sp. CA-052675 TaxID=3239927 RepID=UPI003D8BF11B